MLRSLLWRLLLAASTLLAVACAAALLDGRVGAIVRSGGRSRPDAPRLPALDPATARALVVSACLVLAAGGVVVCARTRARRRRRYVRLQLEGYRGDHDDHRALQTALETLHATVRSTWWERLWRGQPSFALELHLTREEHGHGAAPAAWAAVCCPVGLERIFESALRGAYPSLRLAPARCQPADVPWILRLRKRDAYISRLSAVDPRERERQPRANRLLGVMDGTAGSAFVQLALAPAPTITERMARRAFIGRESAQQAAGGRRRGRSMLAESELLGALDLQHAPLFYGDVRVVAAGPRECRAIAAQLRSESAENGLVGRWGGLPRRPAAVLRRRVLRGEGDPLPAAAGIFAAGELAHLWQLPSSDFAAVPFARARVPVAPAPPGVYRPARTRGLLRDEHGPVSIHAALRRQNVAVPGAVEQGKSSVLVASVAEDLVRERCAVIVLDPKGDAADAAMSLVPEDRTCTLLDFARPACGFNPLAVDAPADVIADYVVGALRNLFSDDEVILQP